MLWGRYRPVGPCCQGRVAASPAASLSGSLLPCLPGMGPHVIQSWVPAPLPGLLLPLRIWLLREGCLGYVPEEQGQGLCLQGLSWQPLWPPALSTVPLASVRARTAFCPLCRSPSIR